jgi:hypothetical protein
MILKLRKLIRCRRGINAVISNVILTGAVIAVSFFVWNWMQYRASNYSAEIGNATSSDIDKLKERVAFEYVFYKAQNVSAYNVSAYIMNSGTVDNVSVQTVYIIDSTGAIVKTDTNPTLESFSGTPMQYQDLDISQEGRFQIPLGSGLVPGSYTIQIVTGRGSIFVNTFKA